MDRFDRKLYDAISKSPEIQDLIRKVVNVNTQGYPEELEEKVKKFDALVEECKLYKNSIKNYQSEIARKDAEIERLKNEIFGLDREKQDLRQELDLEKEKVGELKRRFESPIKYFELYRELSDSVKDGLENVINSENEMAFIVSCSNEENLSSIWEYIKELSSDRKNKEFEVLTLIFDYFFEIFNESLPEVKYKRDNVEIGDDFDDDDYDRCSGSATSGTITKIILRGYKLKNTGKIVHKSLVKV